MQEIWKDIFGYNGIYQISNFGNVRSLERTIIRKNGRKLTSKSRVLANQLTNNGYLSVGLSFMGIVKVSCYSLYIWTAREI